MDWKLARIVELEAALAQRDELIAALQQRLVEVERRLNQDSGNSSKPPSTDAPWKRKRSKGGQGGKPGAKPGHQGKHRKPFDPGRVDEIVPVWPMSCKRCNNVLPHVGVSITTHQVAEVPPVAVRVTEYQLQRVCCPACAHVTLADLPAGVTASAFGPRLHALVATLTAQLRGSRRNVADILTSVFALPVSIGGVDAMLERVGDALNEPYQSLCQAVAGADHVNADETGWKIKGERRHMWGAFTAQIAVMMIDPNRNHEAATRLLGDHQGVVSSDRHGAYRIFGKRQICWPHVDRNLSGLAEYPEPTRSVAFALKACIDDGFEAWHAFRDEHQDRRRLRREMKPIHKRMQKIIEVAAGQRRDRRSMRFCRLLAKDFEYMWTFVEIEGVEPTNNHAERGLRGAVISRKLSGGSQSERGARTTERLLSVAQTCRQQNRSLFEYLAEVMTNTARGDPPPSLIPT